jgi:multiple sugar transport system substrate-binding protein
LLVLAVAATSVATACGSESDTAATTAAATEAPAASETAPAASGDATATGSDAGTAAPSDSGPVTHWQHHSDARAELVKGFIKSYGEAGGAKVSFESIPYSDYFTRLGAALEAGTGPCVFQLPANILAEFQKRGELAPVPDDVMTTAEIEETFTPASTKLLNVEGRYYGLPTDVQTMLLFYNDDLFKAAGLDPTKDFTSWEEFRQAAIKLTKKDGDKLSQAGLDIAGSPYQWYYSAPTLAYEDGLVNDDTLQVNYASEPAYEVWDRITSLVTKDKVDDPEFLAEQSKFPAGLAGMVLKEYTFKGVYDLSAPDLNISVHMPPPVADDQAAPVVSTSWSYVVGSDCKNQAGGWNWIEYLTSEDAQRTWISKGGELPSRTALLDDASLAEDPSVAVGFKSLAEAVPYDSIGWDDAFEVQQEIWDKIVVKGTDVKTAVDAGAAAENKLYATKGVTK